jgi:hypothetical protein
VLAVAVLRESDFASVVAHELTHHALAGCGLPIWIEEGLTQMFEERVTGYTHFTVNIELVGRHRARWDAETLATFLDGRAFASPIDDTQELAYHLAQWVVRSELTRRPARFFEFARACRDMDAESAAQQTFSVSCEDLVQQVMESQAGG